MTCEKLKIKIFRDIIKVNIGAKGCDYDEPRQLRQLPLLVRRQEKEGEQGGGRGDGDNSSQASRPCRVVASFQLWLLMAFAMCVRIDVRGDGDDDGAR